MFPLIISGTLPSFNLPVTSSILIELNEDYTAISNDLQNIEVQDVDGDNLQFVVLADPDPGEILIYKDE